MKTVLGIVGSPRRGGNTHVLMERVLEGAGRAGARSQCLLLGDMTIDECDGCHACWQSGRCARRDGMSEVYALIRQADVLVFGTPVYWYGPTALLKAFVDRLVFFNCPATRPGIRGKRAGAVVPYEETAAETAAPVLDFLARTCRYLELDLVGSVVVPGVTAKGEVRAHPDALQRAFDLGVRLVS